MVFRPLCLGTESEDCQSGNQASGEDGFHGFVAEDSTSGEEEARSTAKEPAADGDRDSVSVVSGYAGGKEAKGKAEESTSAAISADEHRTGGQLASCKQR